MLLWIHQELWVQRLLQPRLGTRQAFHIAFDITIHVMTAKVRWLDIVMSPLLPITMAALCIFFCLYLSQSCLMSPVVWDPVMGFAITRLQHVLWNWVHVEVKYNTLAWNLLTKWWQTDLVRLILSHLFLVLLLYVVLLIVLDILLLVATSMENPIENILL